VIKNMKILSLDTSSKHFSVGLTDGQNVLAFRVIKNDKVLSSKMIPALKAVFKAARLKPQDLDGIAVGLGPGSFTSLRVGFATVKGLALALNKPVVGVASFDSIAASIKIKEKEQLCVIVDAKRDMVYSALYQRKDGQTVRCSELLLTGLDDLLSKVSGRVVFAGDGIPIHKDEIVRRAKVRNAGFKPVFLDEKFWYPSAKQIAFLALSRFENKDVDNINTLVPLYLYPQDCQVKR